MSFGFSIGDFISVSQLARDVYKQCRDSPTQYSELAKEALQLSNVLRDLEDVLRDGRLGPRGQSDLLGGLQGCKDVLAELHNMLNRSRRLGSKTPRLHDKLLWDQQNVRDIRIRLVSCLAMLSSFWSSLHTISLLQIQSALDGIKESIKLESKDSGTPPQIIYDKQMPTHRAWAQIIERVEKLGISPDMADQNQQLVVDQFERALNEGRFGLISPTTTKRLSHCPQTGQDNHYGTEAFEEKSIAIDGRIRDSAADQCINQDPLLQGFRRCSSNEGTLDYATTLSPPVITPWNTLPRRPPSMALSVNSVYVDALESLEAYEPLDTLNMKTYTALCEVPFIEAHLSLKAQSSNNDLYVLPNVHAEIRQPLPRQGRTFTLFSDPLPNGTNSANAAACSDVVAIDAEFTIADREPILDDALKFLDYLKVVHNGGREHIYKDFLDTMRDYKYEGLNIAELCVRVGSLLASEPEVLKKFCMFLPRGSIIEHTSDPVQGTIKATMPFGRSPLDYAAQTLAVPPLRTQTEKSMLGTLLSRPTWQARANKVKSKWSKTKS